MSMYCWVHGLTRRTLLGASLSKLVEEYHVTDEWCNTSSQLRIFLHAKYYSKTFLMRKKFMRKKFMRKKFMRKKPKWKLVEFYNTKDSLFCCLPSFQACLPTGCSTALCSSCVHIISNLACLAVGCFTARRSCSHTHHLSLQTQSVSLALNMNFEEL